MNYRALIWVLVSVCIGAILFILLGCSKDICLVFEWQKVRSVDSFEDCAKFFPVMESFPRRCMAGGENYVEQISKTQTQKDLQNPNISVNTPQPGSTVGSPLTIVGQARGSWYYEASFPVKLFDADGNLLASAPAQAQGEWMTTDFVPFSVTLTFTVPKTSTGILILEKDNPSDLPQNSDQISIPVNF